MFTAELTIMDLDTGTPEEAARALLAAAGEARPLFIAVKHQHTGEESQVEINDYFATVALEPVAAAQAAIDAHNSAMRLEDGSGLDVDLWHLLRSLIEWADAKGVDLDAELSSAREDIREMEAQAAPFAKKCPDPDEIDRLYEIADGAMGEDPATRGRARDRIKELEGRANG